MLVCLLFAFCLFACFFACLFACLSVCLSVCDCYSLLFDDDIIVLCGNHKRLLLLSKEPMPSIIYLFVCVAVCGCLFVCLIICTFMELWLVLHASITDRDLVAMVLVLFVRLFVC